MHNYHRVIVTGRLKTCSYLHIGSGEEIVADGTENKTSTIIKTTTKIPRFYIPASSLRGFLFAKGKRANNNQDSIKTLFGFSIEDARKMGCCRFSNAYASNAINLEIRHGIEVNPKTRLVNKHKLYSYEVIPEGVQFDFNLEMDACSDEDIQALCNLIAYWDGKEHSAIGSKCGQGFGKMCIENLQIRTLTEESILQWLDKNDDLVNHFQPYSLPETQLPETKAYSCILHATSPIIVRDASNKNTMSNNQLICHQTQDNKALIPGTSLKGLLKGHCYKILLTILSEYQNQPIHTAEDCVKKYLTQIFGSEDLAGFIKVSEAISNESFRINTRPMIAIDRFSGGVKGGGEKNEDREEKAQGALLEIIAADNELWSMTIYPHETVAAPEGDGWKGLLLLTLRDAMEGDLSIGLGKSRGFGEFWVEPEFEGQLYSSWEQLMIELQNHYPLQEWIQALHDELEQAAELIKEAS